MQSRVNLKLQPEVTGNEYPIYSNKKDIFIIQLRIIKVPTVFKPEVDNGNGYCHYTSGSGFYEKDELEIIWLNENKEMIKLKNQTKLEKQRRFRFIPSPKVTRNKPEILQIVKLIWLQCLLLSSNCNQSKFRENEI